LPNPIGLLGSVSVNPTLNATWLLRAEIPGAIPVEQAVTLTVNAVPGGGGPSPPVTNPIIPPIKTDGQTIWMWIVGGIIIVFFAYNLIYFQMRKKWPNYSGLFEKIKGMKSSITSKSNKGKTFDAGYYDVDLEYEDTADDSSYYRRNNKRGKKPVKRNKGARKK
jgi:hypothetical protein